jgi:transposase, IS6 family
MRLFSHIVQLPEHRLAELTISIKRLTKPGMGFFSFETAWRTLQGFEVMNMIRNGQVKNVDKGDILGQVALVSSLVGVAV